MGAIIGGTQLNVVFVDDDPKEIEQSIGFSPNIFTTKEWNTLKEFANKRRVHQKDLNLVFRRFLTHEEVYLRKFHVRMIDVKSYFANKSRLMQEICDVLVPMIFLKEYRGLDMPAITPGNPVDDVSFARFIIMGYVFCAQPIPDLIFDFLAILRHKLNLKLNAVMFLYNFEQIIKLLLEEITPCITVDVLLKYCNHQNDAEIDVQQLMLLCLKYPIAFYSVVRFRTHFKRMIFGDKFWANKSTLKSRFYSKFHLDGDYSAAFHSEPSARRETARALLMDAVMFHHHQQRELQHQQQLLQLQSKLNDNLKNNDTTTTTTTMANIEKEIMHEKFTLNEHIPVDPMYSITEEAFTIIKSLFGYQHAKGLVIEAEIPLDKNFPLFKATALGLYTAQQETLTSKKQAQNPSSQRLQVEDGENGVLVLPEEDPQQTALIPASAPAVPEQPTEEAELIDELDVHYDRWIDNFSKHEFIYSVETGVREWVKSIEAPNGQMLREITTKYPHGAIINHYLTTNDTPITKLSPTKHRRITNNDASTETNADSSVK